MTHGEYDNLPEDLAHLRGFRVNDLVAKIAGVSLKNATRAMLSTEMVCWFLDTQIENVTEGLSITPATPDQYEACTKAYDAMSRLLSKEGATDIRAVKGLR